MIKEIKHNLSLCLVFLFSLQQFQFLMQIFQIWSEDIFLIAWLFSAIRLWACDTANFPKFKDFFGFEEIKIKNSAENKRKENQSKIYKNTICTVFTKVYFQQVTESKFSEFDHSLNRFKITSQCLQLTRTKCKSNSLNYTTNLKKS